MKVFISYSHKQEKWVLDRLAPCLYAAGVEVYVDVERFAAGKVLLEQMDENQDKADKQILVFSNEYLDSLDCGHEMKRAFEKNNGSVRKLVIPIIRCDCDLPSEVDELLCVNLIDDSREDRWDKLLQACEADLGLPAPVWLEKRNDLRDKLQNNESVNLVINGKVKWGRLLDHLMHPYLKYQKIPVFNEVDLFCGSTTTRADFVRDIINKLGGSEPFAQGKDLVVLDQFIRGLGGLSRLLLLHMDKIKEREYYDNDLFDAFCYLVTKRHLQLAMISRNSLSNLLPRTDKRALSLTSLANVCQTVEFK